MTDDKQKNIIAAIKAKHDVSRAAMPKCIRCGKQTEGKSTSHMCQPCAAHIVNVKRTNTGTNPWIGGHKARSLTACDRIYQASPQAKERITLPKLNFLKNK